MFQNATRALVLVCVLDLTSEHLLLARGLHGDFQHNGEIITQHVGN